ncbi:glycosyltransferase [Yinghuangia seranimata]|uniref:glycosyltransferase n=1 Tax=Yinghuangia seranimata TaxID=408067 RepID=UPI00248BFC83|nr:glycosyltransferase [Yinghuangia seranimata]MDI2132609.1 glycosyltransferase [Yinghuangia seranimata]
MPLFTQQSAYAHAPAYPRHVVTAILVAHDGARWLPGTLTGLLGQERPVQRVVAVDTGSTDATPRLLEDALGPASVITTARNTRYGDALAEAVRTVPVADEASLPYSIAQSGGGYGAADPYGPDSFGASDEYPGGPRSGELVEWFWLLHDDSEPAPDALHLLLRAADELPSAAVLGPKLRSWYDRRQLLEVGTTIARSGRRWTGLERREQDQGQHDAVRGVLSVGSAGMLVRRDVWEALGGLDYRLSFGRDDTDFGWRVNAAGHRVVVVPDAVVLHAEAVTRERRPIDAGRVHHAHRVDRAGATLTLLGNAPGKTLPLAWLRLFFGSFVRALGYLVGKLPRMALDEFLGSMSALLRPVRVMGLRRSRARTRSVDDADFRDLFPPRGATVRLAFDSLVGSISRRVEPEGTRGRHSVLESGPTSEDAEDLEVENFARLRALAQRPGILVTVLLALVTLVAARDLLTGGRLLGGALLPAPDSAGDLWGRFTETWHGVGLGGDETAPPYLAVVAALGTLLFGSASAAVTVLLVGSVPLAGLTAYLSARRLVPNTLVRAWGAAVYALLPVATGAIASGRIGTAVVLVLAPVIARGAVQVAGLGTLAASWRAAWGTALVLAIATAFVPLTWVVAVVLGLCALPAAFLAGRLGTGLVARLAVALGLPLVLLMPWTPSMFSGDRLFLEAGLAPAGLAEKGANPFGLLLLDPGGPGTIPAFLGAGLLLAALAALLRDSRRQAVLAAWAVALVGLVFAVAVSRLDVAGTADSGKVAAWPGLATVVIGLGYVAAAMVGAEDAKARVAASSFGWRQPASVVVAAVAAATPLLAAAAWVWQGTDGPVTRADSPYVPPFIASENGGADRARTLVLRTDASGAITTSLVRGSGLHLGDAEVAPDTKQHQVLDDYVAAFLSGTGSADARGLSAFAIRYVLLQSPADPQLVARLDGAPGLLRKAAEKDSTLWRVEGVNARVTIQQGDGQSIPVVSGEDTVGTRIDAGPEGRKLRLAERADSGWSATLDGRKLTPVTLDGWQQGFELPAAGGRLTIEHSSGARPVWLIAEAVLLLVVVVLALPARRRANDDDLPETAAAAVKSTEEPGVSEVSASLPGGGRRARRARAAAVAAGTDAPVSDTDEPDATADTDGPPTGSLFVPAPSTAPDPPVSPEDDDWDLGQYARGFQPSESPVSAETGQSDVSSGEYPAVPGYGAGYEQYDQGGYGTGYDSGGYPVPDQYAQAGYAGQPYDAGRPQQGYGQPGYDQGGYGQPGYPQDGFVPYQPDGTAGYPPESGDDAATRAWQPGEDDPWPPQQPPRPGGTR